MANLIFSLNATMPIFLVMMAGYAFRRLGYIDEMFASKMNTFVFKIALPVNLFVQLCDVDFFAVWDTSYVVFCFLATLASVAIGCGLSLLLRDRSIRGEFVQGSYRSSASLLGMAYIENIYGEATMGPLMMLGCVPLYNIMAVVILSFLAPELPDQDSSAAPGIVGHANRKRIDSTRLKSALIGILKNPIIWGIMLGFGWAMTGLKIPSMIETTMSYIGRLASPMGLLAMGAMMDFSALTKKLGPVVFGSVLKLIVYVIIFIPIAASMGFRGEKLVALLVMLGSASTVAGFTMAKSMGHKGVVSSGIVVLSTLLSSFTMTLWIWLLRSRSLI